MLLKLFKQAQKQEWGIGHFNFSTIEQLRGIAEAAKRLKSPVIVAVSGNEARFLGLEQVMAMVRILEQKINHPLFLHLDHGRDLDYIKKVVDFGFDSVHFDGSHLSFEKNIALTKKAASYAHKKGILVEGELGCIKGSSRLYRLEKLRVVKKDLTPPEKVEEFVKKTKIDSLAIAIGSAHGCYAGPEKLDFELLKKVREHSNAFLVLHGASGILLRDIKKAIKLGIQKINVNTDLRIVWKKTLQKTLNQSQEVKPYNILPKVERATQNKVEKYIKLFNSQNKFISR